MTNTIVLSAPPHTPRFFLMQPKLFVHLKAKVFLRDPVVLMTFPQAIITSGRLFISQTPADDDDSVVVVG